MAGKQENFHLVHRSETQPEKAEVVFELDDTGIAQKLWSDSEKIAGGSLGLTSADQPSIAGLLRDKLITDGGDESKLPFTLGAKVKVYTETRGEDELLFINITYLTRRHKIQLPVDIVLKRNPANPEKLFMNSGVSKDVLEEIHSNLLLGLSQQSERSQSE